MRPPRTRRSNVAPAVQKPSAATPSRMPDIHRLLSDNTKFILAQFVSPIKDIIGYTKGGGALTGRATILKQG